MDNIIRVEPPRDDAKPQECDSVLAVWVGAWLWARYGTVGAPDVQRFRQALAEFEAWSRATEDARLKAIRGASN